MNSNFWGWSFTDRNFLKALSISLLWHGFWFFAVVISVNPKRFAFKEHAKVVSLGPVLNDTIFRTLVDSRPETSQVVYRRLSDFKSPVELETRTLEREALPQGQVVSVPGLQNEPSLLRQLIGGEKLSPEPELTEQDPEYLRHWKSRV